MSIAAVAWAFERNLPPVTKLVLLALADHASRDDGSCWPSVKRLAEICCMKPRQVRRHLADLERWHLIERAGQSRQNGSQTVNRYRCRIEDPPGVYAIPPLALAPSLEPSIEPSYNNNADAVKASGLGELE